MHRTTAAASLRLTVPHLLLLGLVALAPACLWAQNPQEPPAGDEGQDFTVVIGGDDFRTQVRLAFPQANFDDSLGDEGLESAREVEDTLRADLEYSGVFNIQGPTELSVLTLSGERDQNFEQYRSLGNEVVLLVNVEQEEGRTVLEGRVYDLPSRQSVLGKRYRGEPGQTRQIAHTLADQVVRQFTGRPSLTLTTIAFQSDRDGNGRMELYLMDYDGHNQRRISAHRSTSGFVDWSPAGDALAYLSYYTGNSGVHYVDIASNRKIPVWTEGTLNLSPSFSPDGRQIAFAHSDATNVDIFVCPRDGCTSPRRLTRSGAIDTNPAWSPDGRRIAFTSDRAGRPNIYEMDLEGGNLRRISFEGEYNEGACWRPDGAEMVYASRRGNKFRIAVTNLVDLETRILVAGPESYETPCYSPDGRRIAYTVMKRGRESQVHVMDVDGGHRRQLTFEGRNLAPDWSNFPKE